MHPIIEHQVDNKMENDAAREGHGWFMVQVPHLVRSYVGGCQNYGPFLGPYYNTAPNIWGTQKGTIILQPPISIHHILIIAHKCF